MKISHFSYLVLLSDYKGTAYIFNEDPNTYNCPMFIIG